MACLSNYLWLAYQTKSLKTISPRKIKCKYCAKPYRDLHVCTKELTTYFDQEVQEDGEDVGSIINDLNVFEIFDLWYFVKKKTPSFAKLLERVYCRSCYQPVIHFCEEINTPDMGF